MHGSSRAGEVGDAPARQPTERSTMSELKTSRNWASAARTHHKRAHVAPLRSGRRGSVPTPAAEKRQLSSDRSFFRNAPIDPAFISVSIWSMGIMNPWRVSGGTSAGARITFSQDQDVFVCLSHFLSG